MKSLSILLVSCLVVSNNAFSTRTPKLNRWAQTKGRQTATRFQTVRELSFSTISTALAESSDAADAEDGLSWRVDGFFALVWISLLVFAVLAPGEIGSPQDSALIEAYISNPTDPDGFNPLFLALFNLLGLIPIVGASIAVPQGSRKGLPSAPFFALSAAAGYFAAGIYLAFRAPPREQVGVEDVSWITRNVIENKIFNWLLVGSVISIFFVTGVASALIQGEFGRLWESYIDLASHSKFVSVSSADAVAYSIALAPLVGTDYKLRDRDASNRLANMVGLATLLLPFVGPALYCALRPKLSGD